MPAAPTITSTDPVNGDAGVAINKKVSVTFTEAMDPGSLATSTFKVTAPDGTEVPGTVTYVGLIALFSPTGNLTANTLYTGTVTTAARGVAGNPLAENYTWTFTTGAAADTTAPTVSTTDPLRASLNVALNKKFSVTFSEGMDPSSITTNSFTVTGPGLTAVPGTVTYVGQTAIFTPMSNLAANTLFTATITTGVKDLAGNALAAVYTWSFTSGASADATAPTVTSTDPANNAIGVALNKKIAATFNEGMDSATINNLTFTVTGPGSTAVPGTVSYVGQTANFSPTTGFVGNAIYTVTITTGAKDLAGNALAANHTWKFTAGAGADAIAPTVTSTDPSNNAVGVALNKKIAATFNEGMNSATINNVSFTVTGPGLTAVPGTVTYVGQTANFTPTSGFQASTLYTATITTGAKDLAGNALAANYTWKFTTGTVADTTAPTVTSTDPANNAIGVVLNKTIAVPFSEGMDSTTISNVTFTVTGPGLTPVPGAVTYVGQTANFTPTTSLTAATLYTAKITTGVQDLAGNALAANYTWTFTTGAGADTTAPTVSSTDPANNAVGVVLNKKIAVPFSEGMDSSTINNVTFTVTGPGLTAVPGTVTYVGQTASFKSTADLLASTLYTATITTGAKDLAGNALAANYTWTFTTGAAADAAAPTVISTDPANNAVGVALNKTIAVAFSEGMDSSTIDTSTFKITGPGLTAVPGTVSYIGQTASFKSTSDLTANTLYTATINTGAMDLAGNALAADYTWTFTTGAAPDIIAPTVIGVYPASNTQNVGVKDVMAASFSEGLDPLTINSTNFKLAKLDGTPVAGTVSYDSVTWTATFTPSLDLSEVTTYTATIATGVKDLAGNELGSATVWTFMTGQAPPVLGRGSSFVLLATTKIDGVAGSNINGDVGLSPNDMTSMTLAPIDIHGTISTGLDQAVVDAQADLLAAYNFAAGKSTNVVQVAATDLGGKTFYPGLYKAPTSFDITLADFTLDAQGNPNAIFVFQMESTLTVAVGRRVILAGGAKANNVYWQVGSSATLNGTSVFKGNILANVSITVNNGSDVEGRLLAGVGTGGAGAVTFNQSTINRPLP